MNLLDVAIQAALEAGELLRSGFGTDFEIASKEGAQNLVTEYDYLSQNLLIQQISSAFPSHHFLAEEGNTQALPDEDVLWIIDPLDGTVNFAHKIPFYGISIAAAKGREIVAGVVYNPMLNELFTAEKGSGAFLGKNRISVTKCSEPEKALLATGFPYDVKNNPRNCMEIFTKVALKGIPIRRLGVASLDLAYVAAGRFDAFWEVGLHPWDMAAGKLLVEEAGGRVSDYKGGVHQIFDYLPMLATNGHLHKTMLSYLQEEMNDH